MELQLLYLADSTLRQNRCVAAQEAGGAQVARYLARLLLQDAHH